MSVDRARHELGGERRRPDARTADRTPHRAHHVTAFGRQVTLGPRHGRQRGGGGGDDIVSRGSRPEPKTHEGTGGTLQADRRFSGERLSEGGHGVVHELRLVRTTNGIQLVHHRLGGDLSLFPRDLQVEPVVTARRDAD